MEKMNGDATVHAVNEAAKAGGWVRALAQRNSEDRLAHGIDCEGVVVVLDGGGGGRREEMWFPTLDNPPIRYHHDHHLHHHHHHHHPQLRPQWLHQLYLYSNTMGVWWPIYIYI